MPACVHDPRIDQLARCTDELSRLREYQKDHPEDTNLGGVILGEMDWLTELHRLIWEEQ